MKRIAERTNISEPNKIKGLIKSVLRDGALVLKHDRTLTFQDFDGFFYYFAMKDTQEFDLTLKTITIKPSGSLHYKMCKGIQLKYRNSPYANDKIEVVLAN